jgi:IclR family acetate operon transcriptional repressor
MWCVVLHRERHKTDISEVSVPQRQEGAITERNSAAGGGKPILVLRKARRVLDCFSDEGARLTFQQVQRGSELPASTCLRLLQSLVGEGFLDRVGDHYRPGINLLHWASLVPAAHEVINDAAPFLARLREATGETACLYVRDSLQRTCVAMDQSRHSVIRQLHVGKVMPLGAGSAGKVFLAFDEALYQEIKAQGLVAYTARTLTDPDALEEDLRQVRATGVSTSVGERDLSAASISAPVFDARGEVVAVIGIAGPKQRFQPEVHEFWIAVVKEGARELSRVLGHAQRGETVWKEAHNR